MNKDWLQDHLSEPPPKDEGPSFVESMEWLKALPSKVKELAIKFPPSCVVQATKSLVCPAPGKYGIVVGYYGNNEVEPMISVLDPESRTCAQCKPEWLIVTDYARGLTPEKIRTMIWGDVV